MECPICQEVGCDYHFNGCSHSVCQDCAKQMGEHTTDVFHPFGEEVILSTKLPRLTCPLCRAQEVMSPEDREDLNNAFPDAYNVWFQLELFRDEWGTMYYTSMRKNNFRLLPTDNGDVDTLLERIPFTSRTTGCYVGYHNLYTDPYYFIQPPMFPTRSLNPGRSFMSRWLLMEF